MSKDLFLMMREQEISTDNFLPTKKELVKTSSKFATDLIDAGEHNLQELYAQALRLKESLATIEKELKNALPEEDFEAFGLKGQYRSGGATLNYKEDPVWADLEKKLADRETLLKASLSSDSEIYDSEGIEVPKVSKIYRKSSLAISF